MTLKLHAIPIATGEAHARHGDGQQSIAIEPLSNCVRLLYTLVQEDYI
jgi:hypothetical protein